MNTLTEQVGLIGWPVGHSLSPAMHNAAFRLLGIKMEYRLLPTAPDEFEGRISQLKADGYAGWNITVPHKERMMRLLDEVSVEVAAIGACNTVRVAEGRLHGFNTDPVGFLAGLDAAGGIPDGSETVVLGAGGSARAVVWALASRGHKVHVFARRLEQAAHVAGQPGNAGYASVQAHALEPAGLCRSLSAAALIVNCTPAGMAPQDGDSPLPPGVTLAGDILAYDLVYRPRLTPFLRQAREAGCRTQDGLAMLVGQGGAAFTIWTGQEAPVELMREACERTLRAEEYDKSEMALMGTNEIERK